MLICNATALVGAELTAVQDATIEVRGGVIIAIGTGSSKRADQHVVDGRGGFIMPGLVDWHVHLDLDGLLDPLSGWRQPPDVRALTIALNCLRCLRAGITTVRDLGSADHAVLRFRGRMASHAEVVPRIFAAGRMIMMTGGHAHEVGRVADGAEEVRRAVREQVQAGADVVKVMASGGFSTPGDPETPEYSDLELTVAVEEAARAGVTVAAHAHADRAVIAALEAGVGTIEHGGLLADNGATALAASRVPLVPTIRALAAPAADDRADPAVAARYRKVLPVYRENVARAVRAGGRLVAGTDAGTYLNGFGGLVDELEEYVELGLSPAEALRSGTSAASEQIGRIDVGMPADLVVVADDPRSDLTTLRTPTAVVARGSRVDLAWIDRALSYYLPEQKGSPCSY